MQSRSVSIVCAAILLLSALPLSGRPPVQGRGAAAPASQAEKPGAREQAIRLNNTGSAYMNQQSFEKALGYFQQAFVADSQMSAARLNEAIAYLNLQQTDKALPILQAAVEREPGNARAWYNLGLLYRASGEFSSATEAFRKVTQLAPQDADAFYFLGASCAQAGDNACAIDAFRRALQFDRYHASAEFGLARAYQRAGDAQTAREHLARFQHLTQTKLGAPITLSYGEQGRLSLVETVGSGGLTAPPPVAVRFTEASSAAGLNGKPSAADPQQSLLGAGACALDFDRDGSPDLFLTGFGPEGRVGLYRNVDGKLTDITRQAGLSASAPALSCAAADYDNDGNTDLAVGYRGHVALYHNESGKFRDATQQSGIAGDVSAAGLLWVDYDHDGDVDFYAVHSSSGGKLWRNNGNRTFTDVTTETGLNLEEAATVGLASDANNDRAVDLIITRRSAAPLLFTNPREGKWTSSTPWPASVAGAASVTSLDFNKDGWMDLAFAAQGAPGVLLLRNVNGRNFEEAALPRADWSHGVSVLALDYDNDGFVDLAVTGVGADGRPAIRLLRSTGGAFQDVTTTTGLNQVKLQSAPYLITADFDGDGDGDILITQSGVAPLLLKNDGGNQNHSVLISLKGQADNKNGIGTKVEVFAGELWQKWEVHGGGGGPGQSSLAVRAGLGRENQAEVVRLLWPTGVIQDEITLAASKPQQITEIDRRGSSCPVLFAWNGKRYEFISDMIGAGVVGHWVGPGQRNVPDSTEYLKVSGEIAKPLNGQLSFRFMEPMEEVVYLDQVRLLAVDHPADSQVYPNEYFASNPPFPEFKVIAAHRSDVRPAAGAWDDDGRDVVRQLSRIDHTYVSDFRLLQFPGYTEPHSLEFDLGAPYEGGMLRLLMHGFIEYFTATSMYAAHQAGIDPVAPYVEAQDTGGKWVRMIDDIGFPAGLPRTVVADLTGKVPLGTRRIRIGTNLQIYWDQILIDRTRTVSPSRITEAPLSSAILGFHGYPRDVERNTNARGDHYYVYEQVSRTGPYVQQAGGYTRLGDVKQLLASADERFAIFGSGDAISLDFDSRQLPPLPSGWVRDYFFFADGYEKDMDFYAADGLTVEPIPYGKMPANPYSAAEEYLRDDAKLDYMLEYNTRFLTSNSSGLRSSYRFKQTESVTKQRRWRGSSD